MNQRNHESFAEEASLLWRQGNVKDAYLALENAYFLRLGDYKLVRGEMPRADYTATLVVVALCAGVVIGYLIAKWAG